MRNSTPAPKLHEVEGTLESAAYGHDVKIWINGRRQPEITGGTYQGIRLLSEDHPQASRVPDRIRGLFVLKSGENTIQVAFRKDHDGQCLEIRLRAPGVSRNPLFRLTSSRASRGTVVGSFFLTPGAQTVEIDGDILADRSPSRTLTA